jgi:two-component system, NarL family, sensor kinase
MTQTDPAKRELQGKLDELLSQQRELLKQLQVGQANFKQLARSVWRVQEQEQRKIARELHDGIGQNLAAILHLTDRDLQARGGSDANLEQVRALVRKTLDETRALSRLLRPQILDDLGLESALRWLARTMGETNALRITVDFAESMPVLSEELSTLVFRVTQESLNNTARHAGAARAEIGVRTREGNLELTLSDDGKGCDVAKALAAGSAGSSAGLGGMRDRVRLYDGEMQLKSGPGEGFRISIVIPLGTDGARS